MFYNLLDDGNGDDLSLHAALPVKEGNLILKNKTLLNLVLVPILSYFALPCLAFLTSPVWKGEKWLANLWLWD